MEEKKRFNHRHVLCWLFFVVLAAWSFFVCRDSYVRLFYSFVDFGIGIIYAVFFMKEWCPVPDVNDIKGVDVKSHFPTTWESLSEEFDVFFELFFSKDNFTNFIIDINPKVLLITQLLMLAVLLIAVYLIVGIFLKPKQNNDYGKETKACRAFKKVCVKVFTPSWNYIKSLFVFFRERRYYSIPFWIVFVCSTNVASIVVSFLAYYFYLLGSLSFTTIIYQAYKLSVDMIILLDTLPLPIWIYIGLWIFNKITIYFAYSRLDRQEHKNILFLKARGIVIFITGVMRAGKTTLLTLLMKLQAKIYRMDSKKILLKVHTHFPYFPFPVFQQKLLKGLKAKKIKSLASVELYIDDKRKKFVEQPCSKNIYGYDFERYGYTYDDGLVVYTIWDDLLKYAQAFLVYTEPTYYVTTYSVRENQEIHTVGNLPRWDMDLFRRDSFDGSGEYSHILDHDMIRPGKKMHPENNKYGALEYGILGIPEIDKERANTLELQEVKAKEDECNQKNDLVNQHIKMMGHGGMIDFKCFIRLFSDSQRASSWGADGRELSDVLSVDSVSEDRLTLRWFNWRMMLMDFFQNLHDSKTFEHWYNRGDTSLPIYLIWKLTCRYLNYCERIWNTFGYTVDIISTQAGTMDGAIEQHKIYVQRKAVYSGDFATDSHVSYFRKNNLKANISLDEIERYQTLHPTYEDMAEKSNSHMYKKWTEQSSSTKKPKTKR